ncbi:MAG: hypothetical protein RMJ84_12180 [Sandaracinaceae bacterium]|nr:hypothetical protein [Sandaracinaceae bacterium]
MEVKNRNTLKGLGLFLCFLLGLGHMTEEGQAQRGRRGSLRRREAVAATRPEDTPRSAAIAPALEEVGIRWGMTPREVFEHFKKQIEERYRPRLAKAPGAIEEDRLQHEMQNEIQRLRRSFVRFNGQPIGWDSSFLRDEYTHGNNESMLVVREPEFHSTSHYFFINDRLWKRYQAFDSSAFPGATFEQFAEAVQRRFGPGVLRSGSLIEGRPPTRWIEWQDETTRLRAVDQSRLYGFFCLVFEDKSVLAQLPSLRRNRVERFAERTGLVDSVLRQEGSSDGEDLNADIVDRLTGQIRRRSDAPATPPQSASQRSEPTSSGRAGTQRQPQNSQENDPFGGWEL